MRDLIPLTENNGETAVLGRDLHAFLESGEQYVTWFKRMQGYGFVEGVDHLSINKKIERPAPLPPAVKTDHILTLDMAKHVAMVQRTDRGRQAREYFIECEKIATSQKPLTGRALMAAALIEAEETMQELEATNQAQALELEVAVPKAEYHDRFISEDSDVLTIDDWAAQYGLYRGTGISLLRDKQIIYKKRVTRELSGKTKEQVNRMEHRAYADHHHMFALRPQLKAPRYNNGQLRQTLYVRVAFSTQLAKLAGVNTPMEGLF